MSCEYSTELPSKELPIKIRRVGKAKRAHPTDLIKIKLFPDAVAR